MSYGFDLLFVNKKFPTEGDAMKYCHDLAKKVAFDNNLAMEQLRLFPLTISNRLRMAGLHWNDKSGIKEALRSETARLGLQSAINEIFGQRFIYWPKYGLLAMVGSYLAESLKYDMYPVYFQNSCDQDYKYEEWPTDIDFFQRELCDVLAMTSKQVCSESPYEDVDIEYKRRSLLYSRIFEKLSLDKWLYHAKDEEGFVNICVNGVVSQEVEFELMTKLRFIIMNDDRFECL